MKIFQLTAKGRYYKTYLAGFPQTQHTTEREAIESAQELAFDNPELLVVYVHEYEVEVVATNAGHVEDIGIGTVIDLPPTIISTPSPSFTEGTANTYDMTQHVSDDGVSPVVYTMSNVLPNGLSFNQNTGILTYDGIGIASVSNHILIATDAVAWVTSSSFNITITELASAEAIFTELIGYGNAVVGGKDGTVVSVTNTNDTGAGSLRQALADIIGPTWIVFTPNLTGVINLGTSLQVNNNNITIDGRGADITLDGNAVVVDNNIEDVIFMYLKHTGTNSAGKDCFNMDANPGLGKFWIHHCTLADAYDECIGVTNDVTDFTISWCKMTANAAGDIGSKAMLFGGSNGATVNMKCTVHHNWISASQRLPRTRNVQLHFYNNITELWSSDNAAVNIGDNGQCYYENNIADGNGSGNKALDWMSSDPNPGDINSVGTHYLLNGAFVTERSPLSVFDPNVDYSYTADTVDASLKTFIEANAGWQSVTHPGTAAPWAFVDTTMLSEMSGYAAHWGVTGGSITSLVGTRHVRVVTSLANSGEGTLRNILRDYSTTDSSGGGYAAAGVPPQSTGTNNVYPFWVVFSPGLTGTISLPTQVLIPANCTIDGRGADITITTTTSGNFRLRGDDNIIIAYLNFLDNGNDGISATNTPHGFWIHHCTLTDAGDECIGMLNGTTDFTVSWCKIFNLNTIEKKGFLIGENDGDPNTRMPCTLHHNWFNAEQRHPRTRSVDLHYYNNVLEGWLFRAVAIGNSGECYFENNMADANGPTNDPDACVPHPTAPTVPAKIKSVGTHYMLNGATVTEQNASSVFTPPYAWAAEDANAVLKTFIESNAGWQNIAHPGTTAPWDV